MRILRVRFEDGVLKPLGEHCLRESQEFNVAYPELDSYEMELAARDREPDHVWGQQRDGSDLLHRIYEERRLCARSPQDT